MDIENNLVLEDQDKALDPSLFTEADMRIIERAEDSIRLKLNLAGECLIWVGSDLIDLQKELNNNGNRQGFHAWANSARCPIGSYKTALDLMAVAREHQQNGLPASSIDLLLSKKGPGIKAIGQVLRLKDAAVKQAALEYTMGKVESGEKVTQAEATKTMAELKAAYQKIDASKAREMTLEQQVQNLKEERVKLAEREKEADRKWRMYQKDAIDADRKFKAMQSEMDRKLQAKQQEIKDAGEVYQDQLEEMRQRIIEEERNRPHTDAEEAAQQARLQHLRDEMSRTQQAINETAKEKSKLAAELLDLRKEVALRDQVLSDFAKAAIAFRETAVRMIGAGEAMAKIPITDALYDQIAMVRTLALEIVKSMESATHVD